ncbi:hypothetical protein HAV15_004878 [Penicillium sp. str. |nr:hypothetical protein HAV15_004878 [Penicillium sp. str. \
MGRKIASEAEQILSSTSFNPRRFTQGVEPHRLHNNGPKAIGKSFRTPRWRPIVSRFHSGHQPSLQSLMYTSGQGPSVEWTIVGLVTQYLASIETRQECGNFAIGPYHGIAVQNLVDWVTKAR